MRFPFTELHGLEDAQRNFEYEQTHGVFDSTPAGGDLSGTFPNPTLAVVPWALVAYSANVATNNTTLSPTWNGGTLAGGMAFSAGSLKVPKAGVYAVAFQARCDTGAAGTVREAILTVNGTGTLGTWIDTLGSVGTVNVYELQVLATNDLINVALFTSVAGTWYGTGAWNNLLAVHRVSN